jgi:site-specific recombinase XerD
MREHKYKKRSRSERPFMIDVIIPGLATFSGKSDRLRVSSETRDVKLFRERKQMMVELGRRLLFHVIAARHNGIFSTEELAIAYKEGPLALKALTERSHHVALHELAEQWLNECGGRSRRQYDRQIKSFIDFCGGSKASVADLTTEKISAWLASLTDRRRGRSGRRVSSQSSEAVAARARRKKRTNEAPAPVSDATRNRHRSAISSLCTYLVNVKRVLTHHPLSSRALPSRPEAAGRMPELNATEWTLYCAALSSDPLAPHGSLLIARILRFAGADIGEVIGYRRQVDDVEVPGMLCRDIRTNSAVTRLRFKRQKVDKSPERFVPYPTSYAAELIAYAKAQRLSPSDLLFGTVIRSSFEAAHRRARKAIHRDELRIKDFRHLAAIGWARAGTPLQRIKEWLGHSTIRQTEVYAKFGPDDSIDSPLVEKAAAMAEEIAA